MEEIKSSEDFLQFERLSSCLDQTFWHKFAQIKLDVDKLDETAHNIWGYCNNVSPRGLNAVMTVDCSSFNKTPEQGYLTTAGVIYNKNTIESFRDVDKKKFIQTEGQRLIELIKEGALVNPQILTRFTVLSYADLKSHKFIYWFAFPALTVVTTRLDLPPNFAEDLYSPAILTKLSQLDRCVSFQVVEIKGDDLTSYNVEEGFRKMKEQSGEWCLTVADTTNNIGHPGWQLRNYLALFAYHCPTLITSPVQVICLRHSMKNGTLSVAESLVLFVNLTVEDGAWDRIDCCTGWELNEKGKFGPRLANLQSSMDPLALAESSADLNLKLMKWQVVPDLDLVTIQKTRCLLLGAGTLGCVVARSLLAWGVRHITLLDNAKVSYSNPARQCLYELKDVGKEKAVAAAEALKRIFPVVVSEGHVLSIPMPGHPVGDSLLKETKENVTKLENLIKNHDVIFLLMDSRESRWLPTVIGAACNKLVITSALGFDSYLVMRHGLKIDDKGCDVPPEASENVEDGDSPLKAPKSIPGSRLSCYFCNDVTAPGNSGQSRTLDQQCTVTRPGVSNMAGSLAVELLVSILQHPAQGEAPSYVEAREESDCLLGKIPHSIRGFLSRFETILPAVESFSSCVACSSQVLKEYKSRGIEFVLDALNSRLYLENLTGLSILQKESLDADILELSSDGEE